MVNLRVRARLRRYTLVLLPLSCWRLCFVACGQHETNFPRIGLRITFRFLRSHEQNIFMRNVHVFFGGRAA